MKKVIIGVVSAAVVAVAACSAVVVSYAAKDNSYVPKPAYYTESSDVVMQENAAKKIVTEEDSIRERIKSENQANTEKIYNQLAEERGINNLDKNTEEYWIQRNSAMADAEGELTMKFANEIIGILQKYVKLENGYTISTIEDDYTIMSAACDLLNENNESLSAEETVMLEMYLEKHYYYIKDDEPTGQLKNKVEHTVELPY